MVILGVQTNSGSGFWNSHKTFTFLELVIEDWSIAKAEEVCGPGDLGLQHAQVGGHRMALVIWASAVRPATADKANAGKPEN